MLEAIFLKRCDQLLTLSGSEDPVDALDLAGVLRQLILDQHSLVHTINTDRLKLRFRCFPTTDLRAPGDPSVQMQDIEAPPERGTLLSLQAVLRLTPVATRGAWVSVADIIRCASNVMGGVHYDLNPGSKYAKALSMWNQMSVDGRPVGALILQKVARILHRGLVPLVEDVQRRAPVAPPDSQSRSGALGILLTEREGWLQDHNTYDFNTLQGDGCSLDVSKDRDGRIRIKAEIHERTFHFLLKPPIDQRLPDGLIVGLLWDLDGGVTVLLNDHLAAAQPFHPLLSIDPSTK